MATARGIRDATLCWNAGTMPVHIRNMSAKGRRVEAAVLPHPWKPRVLKRGSPSQRPGHMGWGSGRLDSSVLWFV